MSAAATRDQGPAPAPHGTIRILLVEDDVDHARLVEHALPAEAGFQIDHVRTGGLALQRLSVQAYDAALVDYRLPDHEGIQLCAKMRESHTGPLLLVTSVARETAVQRAFEVGVDDYLVKEPGLLDRLANEVRGHLSARFHEA